MARRCRIEHLAPTERRLAPEDDPVAPGGDDLRGETKLRVALADPCDAREHVCRTDVRLHARPVLNRLELLEHDVEAVRRRVRARLDERVTAPDRGALDSGEPDRDALPCVGSIDLALVHLDATHANTPAGGLEPKLVTRPRSSPTRASR